MKRTNLMAAFPLGLMAAFPLLLAAETPGVHLSVPVLGYVFDSTSHSIRLVSGVPGAASLEGSVGGAFQNAWVDSSARLAIAIAKDGKAVVVDWNGAPKVTPIESALALTGVSFSESGKVAILTDGATAEVWTNLATAPGLAASHHPDGGVGAVAVRDDGAAAIASGGTVALLTAGASRILATGTSWKALAFLPGGSDLLAADAGELVRLNGVDANPGRSVAATYSSPASAVAVAADGTSAVVALDEDVLVVNLAGGAPVRGARKRGLEGSRGVTVECGCTATQLTSLAGNLVIHLGGALVLDADADEPRVFTLPQGGSAQ